MAARAYVLPLVLLLVSSDTSYHTADGELGIVRIRAEVSDSVTAYFTGTHIGDRLILTCGHCCESKLKDVEVRILSETTRTAIRSVRGRIVCHNPNTEIGLIQLERHHGLHTACRLAPRDFRLFTNDRVIAYDWRDVSGQEQIYSIDRRVTGVNVYLGSDNIETDGMPREGASGGPLVTFNDRLVVGVTTAANVDAGRGIHTGLQPIYDLLDSCLQYQ